MTKTAARVISNKKVQDAIKSTRDRAIAAAVAAYKKKSGSKSRSDAQIQGIPTQTQSTIMGSQFIDEQPPSTAQQLVPSPITTIRTSSGKKSTFQTRGDRGTLTISIEKTPQGYPISEEVKDQGNNLVYRVDYGQKSETTTRLVDNSALGLPYSPRPTTQTTTTISFIPRVTYGTRYDPNIKQGTLTQNPYQSSIVGRTESTIQAWSYQFKDKRVRDSVEFGLAVAQPIVYAAGTYIPAFNKERTSIVGNKNIYQRGAQASYEQKRFVSLPEIFIRDTVSSVRELARFRREQTREFAQFATGPRGVVPLIVQQLLTGTAIGFAFNAARPSRYIRGTPQLSSGVAFGEFSSTKQLGTGRFDVRQNIPKPQVTTTRAMTFQETPTNIVQRLRGQTISTTVYDTARGQQIVRVQGARTDVLEFPTGQSKGTLTRYQEGKILGKPKKINQPTTQDFDIGLVERTASRRSATTVDFNVELDSSSIVRRDLMGTATYDITGSKSGLLLNKVVKGKAQTVTTQSFRARSLPAPSNIVETVRFLDDTGQVKGVVGKTVVETGVQPTRLRFSETGEILRETVRTQLLSGGDNLRQRITLIPDPVQSTVTLTTTTGKFVVKRQLPRINIGRSTPFSQPQATISGFQQATTDSQYAGRKLIQSLQPQTSSRLSFLVPKGKRGSALTGRLDTKTTSITQELRMPKIDPIPEQSLKIKVPSQKTRLGTRYRFINTPVMAITQPKLVNVLANTAVQSSVIQSKFIQSIIPEQGITQIQRINTITPITTTTKVNITAVSSPIITTGGGSVVSIPSIPFGFGFPSFNFGGSTPFAQPRRYRRPQKGYTRSLASIGRRGKRREASLFDIGSGLTVRF